MSKGQLELLPTLEQSSTRLTPVEHFKKCPNCGCDELTPIGPDVLCLECCWDSTAWDVQQGGMDNVFFAAKEYGFNTLYSVPSKDSNKQNLVNKPLTEEQGA